jgi:hypothetical protein
MIYIGHGIASTMYYYAPVLSEGGVDKTYLHIQVESCTRSLSRSISHFCVYGNIVHFIIRRLNILSRSSAKDMQITSHKAKYPTRLTGDRP